MSASMTQPSRIDLDEEELLHLALHAMRNNRHDEAMTVLKRAIHAFPENAKAHYLLGAEHAQVGLFDRAVTEMSEAVRLDPNLPVARFQLGLLHLTAGRVAEAERVWEALDRLGAEDPLRLFKSGLLHLVRDEFAQCIEQLTAGIERNRLNAALNDDMRRVLVDVQARVQTGAVGATTEHPTSEPAAPLPLPTPSKRMWLSTYDQNQDSADGE